MTLLKLLIIIALIALALTVIVVALKRHKNILISYIQNFVGALFIFSGAVKAVDPLGTAYKMEQYFAEFEVAFEGSAMSFLAPLFPWLSEYSIGFSVFMIVLEIILGLMFIIGSRRKFAFWLFLIIVLFFSVLTGFTYLTGYVPSDVNFFDFGSWGAYDANNMRVTDCGCFGDFLKLEPKTSFYKDLALLIPGILLILLAPKAHQLFSKLGRSIVVILSTVLVLLFCISNYAWDLPVVDFRPFREGVNVKDQKAAEEKAAAEAPVNYKITNKETGEMVELDMNTYLKRYKEFPKEKFDLVQERGEPTVPSTKISEFIIDTDTSSMTEEILNKQGYHFMVVSYKLPSGGLRKIKRKVVEYSTTMDTVMVFDPETKTEVSKVIENRVPEEREYEAEVPDWNDDYVDNLWADKISPLAEAAKEKGIEVYAVTNPQENDAIWDFKNEANVDFPFYYADDILLKTIIRSNPGVVLWKDGAIVKKWHIDKLPGFEEINKKYIK